MALDDPPPEGAVTAIESIRRGLRGSRPLLLPGPRRPRSRAAVALVLGGREEAPSLCFVKRALRPGERWSGDMAFPGGWAEPGDRGACAAAVRETREEVGLALEAASFLGRLDDRVIGLPGARDVPVLSSFVFYTGPGLPALRPDGRETEAAYWIPLAHLRNDGNRTSVPADSKRHPGIRYSGQVIWGLTLWVFDSFESMIRAASGRRPRAC